MGTCKIFKSYKLHLPYWLVQFCCFWKIYLCLLTPNCTQNHVITYTNCWLALAIATALATGPIKFWKLQGKNHRFSFFKHWFTWRKLKILYATCSCLLAGSINNQFSQLIFGSIGDQLGAILNPVRREDFPGISSLAIPCNDREPWQTYLQN